MLAALSEVVVHLLNSKQMTENGADLGMGPPKGAEQSSVRRLTW